MKILTVRDLKNAINDYPDDQEIIYQVSDKSGNSWNLKASIENISNNIIILTLSHPKLKKLPNLKDNETG